MRRGFTRPHGSGRPCRCCQTMRDKIEAGERARVRVELRRQVRDGCLECTGREPCFACAGGGA